MSMHSRADSVWSMMPQEFQWQFQVESKLGVLKFLYQPCWFLTHHIENQFRVVKKQLSSSKQKRPADPNPTNQAKPSTASGRRDRRRLLARSCSDCWVSWPWWSLLALSGRLRETCWSRKICCSLLAVKLKQPWIMIKHQQIENK